MVKKNEKRKTPKRMPEPVTPETAIGLFQGGRFREALDVARALLEEHGLRADLLNLAGISVQRLGDVACAEQYLRQAIATRPDYSPALSNLGLLLEKSGRSAEAVEVYEKALAHDPGCLEAACNLGLILQRRGDGTAAEVAFRHVLAVNPSFLEALLNLSNLLMENRKFEEAETLARRALRVRPDYAAAHFNLGWICSQTGREREGELSYRTALASDPAFVGAANNLGLLLHRLGRLEEAEGAYRQALGINPGYAHAWNNLGNVLAELKRPVEAAEAYEKAVAIDPDYAHATGKLLLSSRQICDWSKIAAIEDQIVALVGEGRVHGLGPFEMLIVDRLTGTDHKLIARRYGEEVHGAALAARPIVAGRAHPEAEAGRRRLRIGYLSSDFSEHATTHLFAGVLDAHDRDRVEVFCYSTARPIQDAGRARILQGTEHFRDFHELSDDRAAQIVASDGIDILVDLKGYTESGRLGIQARRPAPVVVSWLGYPGTLGVTRLADYIIGDPVVTPLDHAEVYSETLALMPHCYQPTDNARAIGATMTRAEAGLPEKALVFCNFNASYKISPAVFARWLMVMHQVPDSVLWLLLTTPETADNLRKEAVRLGIAPERLVFAPPLPAAAHLGRLALADLAVDTFPYTSHTTGSDALWAGVPLATRCGSTFASRVAASLLTNVGLPELIATNDEDYVALLLSLAQGRERLRALRGRLRANRGCCPLFDTRGFAADLLDLYEAIWRQQLQGVRKPIVPEGGR